MPEAVPEAVVRLELVQRSWQAPVVQLFQLLQAQGVGRTVFPGEGRLTRRGPVPRLPDCPRGQRISVVQVAREAERGLHAMNHTHEIPWHAQRLTDVFI